jgi:hypothetical protein
MQQRVLAQLTNSLGSQSAVDERSSSLVSPQTGASQMQPVCMRIDCTFAMTEFAALGPL